MNIDWIHLMWQGRWEALVMIWNAIVTDIQTIWWFGPLLIVLMIAAGRKGIVRLASYIVRVLIHTHSAS